MQRVTLLSLLVLTIVTLSSLAPASALRGKLPTPFVQSNAPSHPPPPPPRAPISSSAAPRHGSSSAVPHVASSSAAVSPIHSSSSSSSSYAPVPARGAYPVNISEPFSPAPSTWSLRYLDGAYYRVENSTLGDRVELSVSERWAAADVSTKLQQLVGDDEQWKRQQKALKRHIKRTSWLYSADQDQDKDRECSSSTANSSCAVSAHGDKKHKDGKHGKHHDKGKSLMSFYLRQSQCRACVQHNADLLNAASTDSLSWLPSYVPAAVMKFCTLSTPKLASEQSPSSTGAPLADWEGVCVPAEAECPSATLDMSILSTSTCAADEPVTKQSCTLCVLDGYTWQTGKRAFKNADNYAGQCVDPTKAASASVPRYFDRAVSQLDGCPSAVYSMEMQQRYTMLAVSFGGMMSVLGLLTFCICLRACCLARKNRQAALLRVTRAAATPAAAVDVPSVSSSPSPSAPPAAGYPAAQSAAEQFHEPLLVSSGLNPPRVSISSAYPQLYSQQVSVTQPAYAYGRM